MLGCNKSNPEVLQRGPRRRRGRWHHHRRVNLSWLFLDYPIPNIGVYTRIPFTQLSFNSYHIIPPKVKTLTFMVQNEVARNEIEYKHKDAPLKSYQLKRVKLKSKKDKIKNPYLRNRFHKTDTRHYQRK